MADTVFEQTEQIADRAQQVVMEVLASDDKLHKLQAAKTMLTQTTAGRRRGWGSGSSIRRRAGRGRAGDDQVARPLAER